MDERIKCYDCGVLPGETHESGCDIERCSFCLGQWIACGCNAHNPELSRWTGFYPGKIECRRLGWFIKEDGRTRCKPSDPGASEDLNRWHQHQVVSACQELQLGGRRRPHPGRWMTLNRFSRSGKTLFVCVVCGNIQPTPSRKCDDNVQKGVWSWRDTSVSDGLDTGELFSVDRQIGQALELALKLREDKQRSDIVNAYRSARSNAIKAWEDMMIARSEIQTRSDSATPDDEDLETESEDVIQTGNG